MSDSNRQHCTFSHDAGRYPFLTILRNLDLTHLQKSGDHLTTTQPITVVDETIAPGLRYTEEVGNIVRSHSVRYCYLWQDGEESAVSELELHSLQQRFGTVTIAAEGIGGVETRHNFAVLATCATCLRAATASMAQRVNVAFVGDAIEGLYEQFGYRTCLAEGHLSLKLRNLEQSLADVAARQPHATHLYPG